MDIDNLTAKRLVVAWMHAGNIKQVVRLMGPGVTGKWVRRAARHLRREGVKIDPRPSGVRVLEHTYVFRVSDADFVDLAGREAYPVGAGTLVEGPWDSCRCKGRMYAGFCIVTDKDGGHKFACRRCVHVVE
jgi:hypothetical protein